MPLMPDPGLEHGAGGQGGQAAAQGQQAPHEADLLAAHAHRQGQVGLAGPEDAHGQALAHVGRPRRGKIGEKPGLVWSHAHHKQVLLHLFEVAKCIYFLSSIATGLIVTCVKCYKLSHKLQHHGVSCDILKLSLYMYPCILSFCLFHIYEYVVFQSVGMGDHLSFRKV